MVQFSEYYLDFVQNCNPKWIVQEFSAMFGSRTKSLLFSSATYLNWPVKCKSILACVLFKVSLSWDKLHTEICSLRDQWKSFIVLAVILGQSEAKKIRSNIFGQPVHSRTGKLGFQSVVCNQIQQNSICWDRQTGHWRELERKVNKKERKKWWHLNFLQQGTKGTRTYFVKHANFAILKHSKKYYVVKKSDSNMLGRILQRYVDIRFTKESWR